MIVDQAERFDTASSLTYVDLLTLSKHDLQVILSATLLFSSVG
jgi:hypothetical protein